jgi:uncharacterized protein
VRVLTSLFFFFVLSMAFAREIPTLQGPVMDDAGVLSEREELALSNVIRSVRDKGGPQFQIYVIDSLEGENLEMYSERLFTTWGLGRKGKDDGLLIFVAAKDHKLRIEVGRGLEGDVTDLVSFKIIGGMKPWLRDNRYADALTFAIGSLSKVLKVDVQTEMPVPPKKSVNMGKSLFFIIFFLLFFISSLLPRRSGRGVGRSGWGSGGSGWGGGGGFSSGGGGGGWSGGGGGCSGGGASGSW